MRQEYIRGAHRIEEVLLSALPEDAAPPYSRDHSHISLQTARLKFEDLSVDKAHLPLDFWPVQQIYIQAGVGAHGQDPRSPLHMN